MSKLCVSNGSKGIHRSSGDNISIYSTTNSTTYVDYLPILQSKFKLNSSPDASHKPSKKTQTAYTKNCNPYVEYDIEVDEENFKLFILIRYSDKFLTINAQDYKIPEKHDMGKFGRTEFVCQDILESGFTNVPKCSLNGSEQEQAGLAKRCEASNPFEKFALVDRVFDRSKIMKSSSAYTTEISHIHNLGSETSSPFVREQEHKRQLRMKCATGYLTETSDR